MPLITSTKMPKTEIDNFTKKVKYELIMKKYNQAQQQFVMFGYFFQSPHLDKLTFHLKLNLINKFMVQLMMQQFKTMKVAVNVNQINLSFNKENYLNNFINEHLFWLVNYDKKQFLPWASFLVGWFLNKGSVSDLKNKSHHLELKLNNLVYKPSLIKLLHHLKCNFKFLQRNNYGIFYLKKPQEISDFLKLLKAEEAVLIFESDLATKQSLNLMQRWDNLDLLNAVKTQKSIDKQINIINYLKKVGLFTQLKVKEQILCNYRLKYKDKGLNNLAISINHEQADPTYTSKSDLAYLFKKLMKIAITYRQQHEE